jgi:hypothetical protein
MNRMARAGAHAIGRLAKTGLNMKSASAASLIDVEKDMRRLRDF